MPLTKLNLAQKANLCAANKTECLSHSGNKLLSNRSENSAMGMYRTGLLNPVNLCNSIRDSNASVEQLSIPLRNRCRVVAMWGIKCLVVQSTNGDLFPNLVYSKELYFYPAASCLSIKVFKSTFFLLEKLFQF